MTSNPYHAQIIVEPMLGAVTFRHARRQPDWVIAGPETGPSTRPCKAEWIDALRAGQEAAGKIDAKKSLHLRTSGVIMCGDRWGANPLNRQAMHGTRALASRLLAGPIRRRQCAGFLFGERP